MNKIIKILLLSGVICFLNASDIDNKAKVSTETIDARTPRAIYNSGHTFFKEKEYEKALEEFAKCIVLRQKPAGSYFYSGESYFNLNQYEKALEAYMESYRRYKKGKYNKTLFLHTAVSLEKQANIEEANVFYKQVIDLYPNTEEASQAKLALQSNMIIEILETNTTIDTIETNVTMETNSTIGIIETNATMETNTTIDIIETNATMETNTTVEIIIDANQSVFILGKLKIAIADAQIAEDTIKTANIVKNIIITAKETVEKTPTSTNIALLEIAQEDADEAAVISQKAVSVAQISLDEYKVVMSNTKQNLDNINALEVKISDTAKIAAYLRNASDEAEILTDTVIASKLIIVQNYFADYNASVIAGNEILTFALLEQILDVKPIIKPSVESNVENEYKYFVAIGLNMNTFTVTQTNITGNLVLDQELDNAASSVSFQLGTKVKNYVISANYESINLNDVNIDTKYLSLDYVLDTFLNPYLGISIGMSDLEWQIDPLVNSNSKDAVQSSVMFGLQAGGSYQVYENWGVYSDISYKNLNFLTTVTFTPDKTEIAHSNQLSIGAGLRYSF